MLLDYIQAAMKRARYDLLEDRQFYAEIVELPGVYATASNLEDCRQELQEVLEGWILISVSRHLDIPALDGLSIVFDSAA